MQNILYDAAHSSLSTKGVEHVNAIWNWNYTSNKHWSKSSYNLLSNISLVRKDWRVVTKVTRPISAFQQNHLKNTSRIEFTRMACNLGRRWKKVYLENPFL